MNTAEFIIDNWDSCVRENKEDNDTLLGLPYPYIVPSPQDRFQEMYYWDTFFASRGLMLCGRQELVKNCCDNMLYLVEKYGFVPNGSRTYYLSRSQPPYLSMMIRDVYDYTKDIAWLRQAYPILKKEYDFWMTRRTTPTGLNQFGANMENVTNIQNYTTWRIGLKFPDRTQEDIAECILSDCESGWDFNPRMDMRQRDFVYLDLNCNLYLYEKNFAYFATLLETGETTMWEEKAAQRQQLMQKYLWAGNCFLDYDFVNHAFSKVFSVASFYPLWAGIATPEQAKLTVEQLPRLEFDHGIATCEKNDVPGTYQWNYPNGWAPLQYIMVCALDRYGYTEDARRIAEKYVKAIDSHYRTTGTLWEKYNVVTGGLDVSQEYEMPPMLGWTAGVYLYMQHYLKQ